MALRKWTPQLQRMGTNGISFQEKLLKALHLTHKTTFEGNLEDHKLQADQKLLSLPELRLFCCTGPAVGLQKQISTLSELMA